MPVPKYYPLLVAMMMVAPVIWAAVPSEGSARSDRAPPPFGIGDWNVTGTETLQNGAIVLDGNLTVEPGGSLTLINYTLQVYCREGSAHGIRVKSGGTLKILSGSVVGSFDTSYKSYARHDFVIDACATAVFENSSFLSSGVLELWKDDALMGGICAYADMTIRNCTFAGSRTAITVFNSRTDFISCSFRGNDWAGAVSNGADTQFENCVFDQNYIGAIPYRSTSSFINCSFNDNFLGAVPDSSTCDFTRCNFSRNAYIGLYCNPQMGINSAPWASTITVDDCLFVRNRIGIFGYWAWADAGGAVFPLFHDLFLTNGEFRDNTQAGMLWPRSDPDIPMSKSPCLWKVTGKSLALNDTLDFNGDISVESGGELMLDRSTLSMDPGMSGWNKMEVKAGGALRLRENSTLRSATVSVNYALACRASSIFELNGSRLRDCGWDAAVPERAGPLMETSRFEISHSWIYYCPYGLVLRSSKGAAIESSILSGSEGGIWASGSAVNVSNSTIGCVTLAGGSVIECVNGSIDTDRLDFLENASRVEIGWHISLSAAWEDGRPAAGANVTVTDSEGRTVFNGSADAAGRFPTAVLWQATLSMAGTASHTPHSVNCSLGPVHNRTSVEMLSSRSLVVILSDRQAPNLTVTSPSAGACLNTTSVLAFGNASDDVALWMVEVSVDSGGWMTVFVAGGCDTASADWNLTLELRDGLHSLEVRATDAGGNFASTGVSFTVDTTAPNIYISSPVPGFLTNLSELAVSGLAEPGSTVTVNGVTALTTGAYFSAVIRLSEGQNDITAWAVDAAGNSNSSSISVRLDTVPPALTVHQDPPGSAVNRPQLNITGEMEHGSSVSVNGRWVVLPGLAASFWTLILLHPGGNIITIVATDRAGNANISRSSVVLDTTPPAIDFIHPPEGFLTAIPSLSLQLLAEGGTLLNVNGMNFQVELAPPGPPMTRVRFNLTLNLSEGSNVIVVRAHDPAGNLLVVTRQVVLDTVLPALSLSSPADGFRTSNNSVFLVGRTDPGSTVWVQGLEVVVGFSGDFGAEVALSAGGNRITVQAQDAAGNRQEQNISVTKTPGRHGASLVIEARMDWMFGGFLGLSAVALAGEGILVKRMLDRRRKGSGRAG
jgi:hypothetical protein